MLSHRSDTRTEETSSFPAAVENTAPVRQKAEVKLPSAVIGPKIRIKGELVGEEDLLVQGQVEGTIELKGHHLTIGEKGSLKANVSAKTIAVEGRVEGDLHGEERIAIQASSHVQGNIKAERVVLEDGAKFRGSIDMNMGDNSDVKTMAPQHKDPDQVKEKEKTKPNKIMDDPLVGHNL